MISASMLQTRHAPSHSLNEKGSRRFFASDDPSAMAPIKRPVATLADDSSNVESEASSISHTYSVIIPPNENDQNIGVSLSDRLYRTSAGGPLSVPVHTYAKTVTARRRSGTSHAMMLMTRPTRKKRLPTRKMLRRVYGRDTSTRRRMRRWKVVF